nr:hypothetical protein [Tanacetum cinerariifolium]
MNVSFDELSTMAFEQRSSKPELNNMTYGHIRLGLDLTYAPSTITTQQPSEGELDVLFEAMYDDYIAGQPSATARTVPPAQEPQVKEKQEKDKIGSQPGKKRSAMVLGSKMVCIKVIGYDATNPLKNNGLQLRPCFWIKNVGGAAFCGDGTEREKSGSRGRMFSMTLTKELRHVIDASLKTDSPSVSQCKTTETTILLGLPEDIYAAVDSCETAQEIWLRVQEIMKGSDIGIQEKKAKLFNEWEMFTSNEGESIESYYHRFLNENGVDMLPLFIRPRTCIQLITLNSPHQDQSSFNQNYLQQPMPNPEDITDPTTAINMALALLAKVFKLNYSTPTNNNQRISSNPKNRQIAQPGMNMGQDRQMQMVGGIGGNQFRQYARQNARNPAGYNDVIENQEWKSESDQEWGVGHYSRKCTVRPRRRDAAYLQTQFLIAQKEEAGIQLQAEEYDLMAEAADLDEIEEVN